LTSAVDRVAGAPNSLGVRCPEEQMSNEFRDLPIRDALRCARDGVRSCIEADRRLVQATS
jgi:hypothetical protein